MTNEKAKFKALNTGKILNAFYFWFHMQKYVFVWIYLIEDGCMIYISLLSLVAWLLYFLNIFSNQNFFKGMTKTNDEIQGIINLWGLTNLDKNWSWYDWNFFPDPFKYISILQNGLCIHLYSIAILEHPNDMYHPILLESKPLNPLHNFSSHTKIIFAFLID